MNIVFLETFIVIVETGNLVRASEKLNVTQSTVTARLKALEESLGQKLLNRRKSGVTLTPAGTKVLRYARIMGGLWRQARREAALPEGLKEVCSLACHNDLWDGPGREVFDTIIKNYPEIAISVYLGSDREIEEWLAAGTVDLAVSYRYNARGGKTTYTLTEDRLVVYSTRREAPIKGDPFYVFVDYGDEFRRRHGESYYDAGIARIEFNSPTLALPYLLAHGGSAYLPERLAEPHVLSGALFELTEAPVYMRKKYLIVNDQAASGWSWFDNLINDFTPGESGIGNFRLTLEN